MNKQLSVVFSIALLLTVTVVASVDFLHTADAAKAQGTSLPEIGSKKVCGDKLCSEVDQSESTKTKHGESSHASKGDCRCVALLKSSIPKAELFENGVGGLEDQLTITVSASNQEMIMSLSADELNGKYYVLFVPTISGQYDVQLNGVIGNAKVVHTFHPEDVVEKSELVHFP